MCFTRRTRHGVERLAPISQAGISSNGKYGWNDITDQRETNRAILPRPYESGLTIHKPNSFGISPLQPANSVGNIRTPNTPTKRLVPNDRVPAPTLVSQTAQTPPKSPKMPTVWLDQTCTTQTLRVPTFLSPSGSTCQALPQSPKPHRNAQPSD